MKWKIFAVFAKHMILPKCNTWNEKIFAVFAKHMIFTGHGSLKSHLVTRLAYNAYITTMANVRQIIDVISCYNLKRIWYVFTIYCSVFTINEAVNLVPSQTCDKGVSIVVRQSKKYSIGFVQFLCNHDKILIESQFLLYVYLQISGQLMTRPMS